MIFYFSLHKMLSKAEKVKHLSQVVFLAIILLSKIQSIVNNKLS